MRVENNTQMGLNREGESDFYSAAGRPRCQVTPYVVNVVVLVGGER